MASFFNMLACTAAYAVFFTAGSRRRAYESGRRGPRHVLPAAWRGALFGVLFMVQIIVPWSVALVITQAQRGTLSLDYVLELLLAMGGILGLFGLFLGAFGGSLVGLVFDWHYARTRATAAPPCESRISKAERAPRA